jgi:hypothetical protein
MTYQIARCYQARVNRCCPCCVRGPLGPMNCTSTARRQGRVPAEGSLWSMQRQLGNLPLIESAAQPSCCPLFGSHADLQPTLQNLENACESVELGISLGFSPQPSYIEPITTCIVHERAALALSPCLFCVRNHAPAWLWKSHTGRSEKASA